MIKFKSGDCIVYVPDCQTIRLHCSPLTGGKFSYEVCVRNLNFYVTQETFEKLSKCLDEKYVVHDLTKDE